MPAPLEKSPLIVAIDFVIGAVAGDTTVSLIYLRIISRVWTVNSHWLEMLLLSTTLIAGSLAALFRNQFWSQVESYSIIPPIDETVPRGCRPMLWILFALGCGSLGLFYFA